MRFLVVHNPSSGRGAPSVLDLVSALAEGGDEVVMRLLAGDEPIADALADAEAYDVTVVSGGDGTVTAGLHALAGRGVRACVWPGGTANLVFAGLGNDPDPRAMAAACRAMTTATVDLGEMAATVDGEARRFGMGLMAGIGLDAQLMESALPHKEGLGEAAYFAAILGNLMPPVVTFDVDVDGEHVTLDGIACVVANTSTIQGDMTMIPGCVMDDGMLDVMVVTSPDTFQLLLPLLTGILDPSGQTLDRPHLQCFRGREIRVRSSAPLPLEVDGEVTGLSATGYDARCLPRAVDVVVDPSSPYFPGCGGQGEAVGEG